MRILYQNGCIKRKTHTFTSIGGSGKEVVWDKNSGGTKESLLFCIGGRVEETGPTNQYAPGIEPGTSSCFVWGDNLRHLAQCALAN
jgi:hypothetical protein